MERLLLRWRAGWNGLLKFRIGHWRMARSEVRFRNNFRNNTEEQPNLAAPLTFGVQFWRLVLAFQRAVERLVERGFGFVVILGRDFALVALDLQLE